MASETHLFPVEVEWFGRRLTRARTGGGQALEIATPPIFPSGMEGFWSPEDMVVGAAASCFVLTLVAACESRSLPLHELRVNGVGHLSKRSGRTAFDRIDLTVTAETAGDRVEDLRRVAEHVERGCIVAGALAVPLRLELELRSSDSPVAV